METPAKTFEEKICVVIPMYRVEEYIEDVIRGLPDWIWRIILVDDQSPDRSAEIASSLEDPRIILVQHEKNQGVGGAVLTGFNKGIEIGATVMVKMDGDNQMSPEYLPDLVNPILMGKADYVKGNRFQNSGTINKMPLIRRIGNIGLSFLTKMASGYWDIFDTTNGFVAIDADTFKHLNQEHIHKRYFFESDMLIELNLIRAVIQEVQMPARYSGEKSSMNIPLVLFQFPLLLIKNFFRRVWLQYFLMNFTVASLFILSGSLLFLFGGIWGVINWRKSILSGVISSTGTVMIAVLPIILGFQLLLQAVVFDIQNIPHSVRSHYAEIRAEMKQRVF